MRNYLQKECLFKFEREREKYQSNMHSGSDFFFSFLSKPFRNSEEILSLSTAQITNQKIIKS